MNLNRAGTTPAHFLRGHMYIRVCDTETTGLDPAEHRIVEIGWTDLRLEVPGWRLVEGGARLINPGRPIPPEASAIHHLLDGDVADAPPWPDGAADILRPDGLTIGAFAAHNSRFDRGWITDDLTGGVPWIDTYRCALRLWPEAPAHTNQALRYWRRPRGLNRHIGEPHRAGPDTVVTAHLLREMLGLASAKELIRWSSEPAILPRCPVGKHRGKAWSEVESGFLAWMLSPGKEFDEDVLHSARLELQRRTGKRHAG